MLGDDQVVTRQLLSELTPHDLGHAALLGLGQRRELAAEEPLEAVGQLLRHDLASDHLAVERIAFTVRRQVHMQMRNTIAEYIDIDELGPACRLQNPACLGNRRTKALRFGPVEFGNVGNMPDRLEIGEAEHLGIERESKPPQLVAPYFNAAERFIAHWTSADDAALRHWCWKRCRRAVTIRSRAAQNPVQCSSLTMSDNAM